MLSDQWLRPLNAGMANALTLRIFSQRLPDRWDLQLDRSMASHTGTGGGPNSCSTPGTRST